MNNLVVKFYEDKYDGDVLVHCAEKEYKVKSKFNDVYIVYCELEGDLNYGVSTSEAGSVYEIYRARD